MSLSSKSRSRSSGSSSKIKRKGKRTVFLTDLPLFKCWHGSIGRISISNEYFGQDWYTLMNNDTLQKSKYSGRGSYKIIETDGPSPGYMLINCTGKSILITNTSTKDAYNVPPYDIRTYNLATRNVIVSNDKSVLFNQTQVGDAIYILLGCDRGNIPKIPLYRSFLIGSGVVNSEQYYSSVGLNAYLDKIIVEGSTVTQEYAMMMDWVNTLDNRWVSINPTTCKPGKKPLIPLMIHWIWLPRTPGTVNPVPEKYFKFMQSFMHRNPMFQFHLWMDNPETTLPDPRIIVHGMRDIETIFDHLPKQLKGAWNMFRHHPNVGSRADTLRLAILYTMGGCYADVNDYCILTCLQGLCHTFDFMAGAEPMLYVNNAFVASAPKHKVVSNFLQFISANHKKFIRDWDPKLDSEEKDNLVVSQTGPIALSGVLYGLLDLDGRQLKKTCIFPSKFFYSNYEIEGSPLSWLSPVSLGAHYDARDFLK